MALLESYIWLRFVQDGVTYAERFNALAIPRERLFRQAKSQEGNRVLHDFTLWVSAAYDVNISADELYNPDLRKFLVNFWLAQEKHLSLSSDEIEPLDTEFILVATDGGEIPEEYIEDDDDFPDWTFRLKEVYRRSWDAINEEWKPVYLA